MKKIISLFFAILMAMPCFISEAYAEGTNRNTEIEFLKNIGILSEDDIPDPSDIVTRGFAAKLFTACFGINDAAADSISFTDVEGEYAGAIMTASRLGIMKGYGDGTFRPQNQLKGNEALSVIVKILGYEQTAENMGGYPSGYLAQASLLKLIKGINLEGESPITFGQLAVVIRNALDVDLMTRVSYGTGAKYEVKQGTTLLTEYFDIYKFEGQVTGNYITSISGNGGMREDEISIEDIILHKGATNADRLLGYIVEAYAEYNDREYTLIDIRTVKTKALTIDSKDISPETTKEKIYAGDNQISIEKNAQLVKNGQVKTDWTKEDLFCENGDITLIAPDGANYDLILVNSYKTLVVDRVNPGDNTIYMKNETGEWASIAPDMFNKFSMTDAKGEIVNIENLGAWAVLSAAKSESGKILRILCSLDSISGRIQEIGQDEVTIDSKVYGLADDIKDTYRRDLDNSAEGVFYLDYKGNIAAYSKVKGNKQYGYLISGAYKDGIDKKLQFKILTESGDVKVFDVAGTIVVNDVTERFDNLRNNGWIFASDTVLPQLIYFAVDRDEKINYIDTAAQGAYMPDEERFASFTLEYETQPTESLFCMGIKETVFLGKWITTTSIVFNVPDVDTGNDKDYKVLNQFKHGETYKNLAFYDVDEKNRIGAVVVKGKTGSSDVSSHELAGIGIVKEITQSMNDDGDLISKLYVFNKSGELEALITDDSEFGVKFSCMIYGIERMITADNDPKFGQSEILLSELDAGDVIMYEKNAMSGQLTAVRVLFRATYPAKMDTFFTTGASIGVGTNYTRANVAYSSVIAVADNGLRVSVPLVKNGPDENERFYFFEKAPKYLFEREKGTIKPIEAESIRKGDMVLTVRQNVNQSLTVIYR